MSGNSTGTGVTKPAISKAAFLSLSHIHPTLFMDNGTKPSSSSPRFHADQATYRDLVIFEERLRGNMTRLQRRKKKYEGTHQCPVLQCSILTWELFYIALLVGILILLVYFFYVVFLSPSKVCYAIHPLVWQVSHYRIHAIGFLYTLVEYGGIDSSSRNARLHLSIWYLFRKDCICIRVSITCSCNP